MNTILCTTNFDITATGVLGQYKENREIINLSNGDVIVDRLAWARARNQQRNWETINQIISLRCLPQNITEPQQDGDRWWFEFDVESLAPLSDQPNDLVYLLKDADGVPMITGLDELAEIEPILKVTHSPNTWFQIKDTKYLMGEKVDARHN